MDGQLFSIDTSATITTREANKPNPRRYCAARTARDLRDVRMLKVRVNSMTALADTLIDWGAGNHARVGELEAALHYPQLQFTSGERGDLLAEVESCSILETACRAELANVPTWAELATRATWLELANVAAQRSQEPAAGRSRSD
jgi:hypothetical protein